MGINFSSRNNFANLGHFAKVSILLEPIIPWSNYAESSSCLLMLTWPQIHNSTNWVGCDSHIQSTIGKSCCCSTFYHYITDVLIAYWLKDCLWELWHFLIDTMECHNSHKHHQSPIYGYLVSSASVSCSTCSCYISRIQQHNGSIKSQVFVNY